MVLSWLLSTLAEHSQSSVPLSSQPGETKAQKEQTVFGKSLRKFMLGNCKNKVSRCKISAAVTALSFLSCEEYLWSKGQQVSEDPAAG